MKGHKIITSWQSTPQLWMAVFDNYDGAVDSKHPMGFGKTEAQAVEDLLEHEQPYGDLLPEGNK
jgi:hypothetical protein